MSDQNKRVLLNDDVVEKISGGELLYYCVRGEQHYMWSDENPDYKYAFEKASFPIRQGLTALSAGHL